MKDVSAFGADARVHHVGIAVKSIAAYDATLETWHDPIQKVRVAFFTMHGITLELIEPAADDAPVLRSLKDGVKLLHTCFEVDVLEPALASGKAAGFQRIRPPAPATAFQERRIAWVFHRELGLVELLERAPAAG